MRDAYKNRDEVDAIKAAHDIVAVVARRVALRKAGREWVGLSPFKAERTPSFYVDPRKQTFFCFCTAQGGDVIRFIALTECGGDDGAAIQKLRDEAGISPDPAEIKRHAEAAAKRRADLDAEDIKRKAQTQDRARDIWLACRPAAGSLVETYLRARGIDIDAIAAVHGWTVPPTIRFHPALPYRHEGAVVHTGPAMVGLLQPVPGERPRDVFGIHRTWLAADGSGKATLPDGCKAKLTLGTVWGCGGWLEWRGGTVLIGEGYETTMSVQAVYARLGKRIAAVSAAALGNLAGAGIGEGTPHPEREGRLPSVTPDADRPGLTVPAPMRRIILLGDNDGRDPVSTRALIARATEKFRRAGADVTAAWPPAGKDFNDLVSGSSSLPRSPTASPTGAAELPRG